MSEPFRDFLPANWSNSAAEMFYKTFGDFNVFEDPTAQALYEDAYFNFGASTRHINDVRDTLDDYLTQTYGINFDEWFDWEEYRERYGN